MHLGRKSSTLEPCGAKGGGSRHGIYREMSPAGSERRKIDDYEDWFQIYVTLKSRVVPIKSDLFA